VKEQSTLKLVREGAVQYSDKSGVTKTLTDVEYLSNQRKKEEEHKKNHNPMELE